MSPEALDLARLSRGLRRDTSGIWTVESGEEAVSFPEHGHEACFKVEDKSFWFRHRNRCIVDCLKSQSVRGPFLDIGGGNGAVTHALERNGFEPVLLEPRLEGARNGAKRGLTNIVCSTLEQAAFEPASFMSAGLFDVIEHVERDYGILEAARKVLRPGGFLCVTVPALGWLWSSEDDLAGHYRRYTLRSLRRALEQASFEPIYATYFFAPLVLPIFLLRSMAYRLRKERPKQAVEAAALRQLCPPGASRMALELLLAPEITSIRRGWTIPLGTSCLALARRAP